MKASVLDIREAHAALAHHGGLSLPAALSMRFARLTRAIRQEAEAADEAVKALVEKHVKTVDGKPVEVELPDGRKDRVLADPAAFAADLKALHNADADIPGEPFAVADLGDAKIASDLLAALHFAFKD